MKVGISTACFYPEQETETALKSIKSLGADCAEVFLRTFYEYRPEFAKAVAPDICGVNVHSARVSWENFEGQLFSASRRIRGDGFYWLDQIMRSAQLLGVHNYTFRGFSRNTQACDDFDALSGYIWGVTEFCARYGVGLCLENAHCALYNRPSVFAKLKRRCPQLSAVLNLAQARMSGYPYTMYLKDMAGAISQVNLTVEDLTDNAELFKRLKDTGFDGAVIIEAGRHCGTEEIKRALDLAEELIYKTK